MKRLLLILFFIAITINNAQFEILDEDSAEVKCSHSSIDIGIKSIGISFGNSEYWNGIRLNVTDCDVKKVSGINITLWNPKNTLDLSINGIALGLAPAGRSINGISIGLAAVLGKKHLRGINIGGIATVGGNMEGFNFGGLATVAKENISGINFGGLATIAKGNIIGFSFGGMALISNQNIRGINIGGLATVSKGKIQGLNIGGLAIVSKDKVEGINVGGLAIVAKENICGINIGGLALVSNGNIYGLNQAVLASVSRGSIKGINISGYKLEADSFYGLNITPGWVELNDLHGVSISSFHKIDGIQKGVVIGVVNIAEELYGFQFGLINIAKNNTGVTKVLPLLNCHF